MAIHNVVPPFISCFCFAYNRTHPERVLLPKQYWFRWPTVFNYMLSGSPTLIFWISIPPKCIIIILLSFYNSEHRFWGKCRISKKLLMHIDLVIILVINNKIGLSWDSPTKKFKRRKNELWHIQRERYYNIIFVMSFTLLSESSVCLQIMLVTMTFPKMERKLYLPLPIILVKNFNMSRLPSL